MPLATVALPPVVLRSSAGLMLLLLFWPGVVVFDNPLAVGGAFCPAGCAVYAGAGDGTGGRAGGPGLFVIAAAFGGMASP